jgi:carboxymethylenebutenolidase
MRIYEAVPDGGHARGGVIVIQEAFGVNDHIEDVTRRAAAVGYHAVAPDLFHRHGGVTFEYGGDFTKIMEIFGELDDDKILEDLDEAVAHLHQRGFAADQIGAVGFCFGGRCSFLLALRRKLGASVGFYGGGIVTARFPKFPSLIDDVAKLQTPWLGLFGDDDASIPVDDVERLRGELGAKARVDTEVVRYAGAGHGFHCDLRPDYRPDQAQDAWKRTLAWFDAHLAPSN